MKRDIKKNDDDLQLSLVNVTTEEKAKLSILIEVFKESHSGAVTIGKKVSDGIKTGKIESDVIERLSKWCKTGGSYSGSQTDAQNLAEYLLGVPLPRLVDSNNRRLPDYESKIDTILGKHKMIQR